MISETLYDLGPILLSILFFWIGHYLGYRERDKEKRYCANCKYYRPSKIKNATRCVSGQYDRIMGMSNEVQMPVFIPSPSYGCVHWKQRK